MERGLRDIGAGGAADVARIFAFAMDFAGSPQRQRAYKRRQQPTRVVHRESNHLVTDHCATIGFAAPARRESSHISISRAVGPTMKSA